MPRTIPLLVVLLISALARPAAAQITEDVPVPAGLDTIAHTIGLDAVPDPARFVFEVTRLMFSTLDRETEPIAIARVRLQRAALAGSSRDRVPLPLTVRAWMTHVFRRPIAPQDLLVTILGDSRATLLCHALADLDTETLQYIDTHPDLLTKLYMTAALPFGAFGGSLRIRNGRVVPPGGEPAVELWEGVVGAKVESPETFVPALFGSADGRVAYLYDTIGRLDAGRRAFALGLWIRDPLARRNAMRALVAAWNRDLETWRITVQPFTRAVNDGAVVLSRVRVDADGTPAGPSSRAFWTRAFEGVTLIDATSVRLPADGDAIDAAWLADATRAMDGRQRADRLDQFAYGQRVFSSTSQNDLPLALVAVRAFPRYRTLLLTLERMGVTAAGVHAAAARRASEFSILSDTPRVPVAMMQFQGAFALLARIARAGTLPAAEVEALARSLIAVPLKGGDRYEGGVLRWLADLRPALPREETLEASILAALAGPPAGPTAARLQWEGQLYRIDLAAAERIRLGRVRQKQGGPPLDLAVDLEDAARLLASPSLAMSDVQRLAPRLRAMATEHESELGRVETSTEVLPEGVAAPARMTEPLVRAVMDVEKAVTGQNIGTARGAADVMARLSEEIGAVALVSLAYAIDIGDAGGPAVLAGDVSHRHDFGMGIRNDEERRLRAPWSIPHPTIIAGQPWYVSGSVLGLDVALSSLTLRRLNTDRVPPISKLTAGGRDGLAHTVALLNPRRLNDAARDAIGEAIDRGEARLAAVRNDPAAFERLADEAGIDGGRRRAAAWSLAKSPAEAVSMFSLSELLQLGQPNPQVDLGPWGMSALGESGCLCTQIPARDRSVAVMGRPQLGLAASSVVDLNLRVARVLRDLKLPAALARDVLAAAMQDLIDEARPTDSDDWFSLARAARALTRERVEDYVAAITAEGVLVPDAEDSPEGVRR